jgi:hypothetical protein
MLKPTVYIASPYSKGDVAINAHFQCRIFNELLDSNKVLPVAPLWSHFQHVLFPRKYEDWIKYDQEMLRLYDCCLRLSSSYPPLNYSENESTGADAEVQSFIDMGKPVFFCVQDLFTWVDDQMRA